MPNVRRAPGVHPNLYGTVRILRLGAEIHDLRQSGFEYERIQTLMGLTLETLYTYHSVYRRSLRETQPTRRYGLGGSSGDKE